MNHMILKIRFTVPDGLTQDEIHDIGDRIVSDLVTDVAVTFDSTEVVDES